MDNRQIIMQELTELNSTLANKALLNPFVVPEGYFANFPHLMLDLNSADTELLPELVNLKQNTGFVPEGYFDTLPSLILKKVKPSGENAREEIAEISPLLAEISRTMPFVIPRDYFAGLMILSPEQMDAKDPELIPELVSLKHKLTYQVPPAYFDRLPDLILEKVNGTGAKVISISRFRTFKKMAVAALIAGIIFTGAWYFNNQSVTSAEIVNIDDISIEELESFSEGRPSIAVEYAGIDLEEGTLEEEDFREFFADLSDQELQYYLIDYSGIQVEMSN